MPAAPRLVIVSNRVPAPKERQQLAGGLAVGLAEAIAGRETLWFGWSGDASDNVAAPQITTIENLTFARVDLTRSQVKGFYEGYSNGLLWPLMHYRVGLMEYRRADRESYEEANERFADALLPLLRPDDLIWVHDYHLIPLGAALRARGVRARIGFFLHIPFPPLALFEALPDCDSLLHDFAAYDLVGVQTRQDADHLDAAGRARGARLRVQAFPIGIDPDGFAAQARRAEAGRDVRRMVDSLGDRALILGIDRLDYSKGIPERLRGYERLLQRFEQHRNKVMMLQVAPVSRGEVAQYKALRRQLDELAGHINGSYAEFDWSPLRTITRSVPRGTLAGFCRLARVALVTPLRDGMNLVAKEYVAAQNGEDPGVLVLSRFAGAADELAEGALMVNPHDPDAIAEALDQALRMPRGERRRRWQAMDAAIHTATAAQWGTSFLADLERLDPQENAEADHAEP
ncbi:alpha,alpha-trehalose-phosphate synthase (UDP-forming) [Endobacter medicaginis]|nr:trehalose-6-phosphate synthase [Endobacter medicaginis]MCX5475680.1 trehalose-6-phosphate synthase [Endobacter medicaginis]